MGCLARIAWIGPDLIAMPGAVIIRDGFPALKSFTSGTPAIVNMATFQCSLDEHSNTGSLR